MNHAAGVGRCAAVIFYKLYPWAFTCTSRWKTVYR